MGDARGRRAEVWGRGQGRGLREKRGGPGVAGLAARGGAAERPGEGRGPGGGGKGRGSGRGGAAERLAGRGRGHRGGAAGRGRGAARQGEWMRVTPGLLQLKGLQVIR